MAARQEQFHEITRPNQWESLRDVMVDVEYTAPYPSWMYTECDNAGCMVLDWYCNFSIVRCPRFPHRKYFFCWACHAKWEILMEGWQKKQLVPTTLNLINTTLLP